MADPMTRTDAPQKLWLLAAIATPAVQAAIVLAVLAAVRTSGSAEGPSG